MNFGILESQHIRYEEVLAVGRTAARNGRRYHIAGMTRGAETKLHIIEPFQPPEPRRGVRNHRWELKANSGPDVCYFDCSFLRLGDQTLPIRGGSASPLGNHGNDLEGISLFFALLDAGWTIPEWLKEEEWENLQLVSLDVQADKLPDYSPGLPITIGHRADPVRHLVEKAVTLQVGKPRAFSFQDHTGETVQCYINRVTLLDLWKDAEERFQDPRDRELATPEQIQNAQNHLFQVLEQTCPRGMYYVQVEYECGKDYSLSFYSKEFLRARPEVHTGSASGLMVMAKPDVPTGTHSLPLKGCVLQTPVAPDTVKIPAELFCYYEKAEPWEEVVP